MRGFLIGSMVAILMTVYWSVSAQAVTYVAPDDSLACAFYTRKDARQEFGERRGHVAFCANGQGWITGAVLSKSGKVRCEIMGFVNMSTGCGSFLWCNEYFDLPCD